MEFALVEDGLNNSTWVRRGNKHVFDTLEITITMKQRGRRELGALKMEDAILYIIRVVFQHEWL